MLMTLRVKETVRLESNGAGVLIRGKDTKDMLALSLLIPVDTEEGHVKT